MATARRAFTSEYTFGNGVETRTFGAHARAARNYESAPETRPERVRRTRQRPQAQPEVDVRQTQQTGTLSAATLRALIAGVIALGVILVAMVIVNAHTANLQYQVNSLENQNAIMQNEIDMLEVKIGSNTSINQLEELATTKLDMHYPEGNECIHLSTVEMPEDSLANIIKQKAYA